MTIYYIRKSGWDGNDGLSPISSSYGVGPWLTIDKANTTCVNGDTVYIGSGSYTGEDITPSDDGVTFIGDIEGTYTGDAGLILIRGVGITAGKTYTTVKCVCCEGDYTGTTYGVYVAAANCVIDSCRIKGRARVLSNCYPFTIKNSAIGIALSHELSLYCIGVNNDLNIYFCTIHQISSADGYAIDLRQTSATANIRFKNNIVISHRDYYLLYLDTNTAGDYSLWDFDYNYYTYTSGSFIVGDSICNTLAEWQSSGSKDLNSFEGSDPTGTDYYHLVDGNTLCDGSGIDLNIYYDIDLDSRPSTHLDIGCDQFNITSSGSIVSDANISGLKSQTLTSDANIYATNQQTILSNAKVTPPTSPDPFRFREVSIPVSSFSLKTKDESKTVLLDAKLKHDCNHNLSGTKYTLNTCPRCLGKGFYFDIKFSPGGDIITINEEEKLLQELVKVILTSKGNNPYHKEFGSVVSDSIGMLQEEGFREAKLKQSIIEAVLRLKYLQRERITMGYKFSLKELIDKIQKIEIYEIENNPTWLGFKVQVSTVEGEMAILQGSVAL